jgi:hypothetical protein
MKVKWHAPRPVTLTERIGSNVLTGYTGDRFLFVRLKSYRFAAGFEEMF